MNQNNGTVLLAGLFLFCVLIGSCRDQGSATVTSTPTRNDYEDMRSRGHSEEDSVIFGILKQQGYSDYEALRATKSSK